jgi:hypothetical protein
MRKASFLTALLLLVPTVSHAKTLEELLIEKGVITKGEAANTSATGNAGAKLFYNEGTRIEFPDAGFSTKIQTLIQTRYTFTQNDEHFARTPGSLNLGSNRANTSSFDVQRARLIVSGTALYQEFAYRLETDFVGTANDGGTSAQTNKAPDVKDAYIAWQPCEEYTSKLGQFHVLISRQNQSDPGKLLLPDNSVVTTGFAFPRSQGFSQSADFADGKFQIAGGVYNGTSDGEGINSTGQDTPVLGVGVLRFNPTGKMDVYEEGDVNYTEDMATSIGLVYLHSDAHNNVTTNPASRAIETNIEEVNADLNLKYRGLSLQGEYFWGRPDQTHGNFDAPDPKGGYVQVGYFVKPKTWELAARYGYVDCADGRAGGLCAGNDKINEAMGGINYYWWKHQLKTQLAYGIVNEAQQGSPTGRDINTEKWIFQVSGYF